MDVFTEVNEEKFHTFWHRLIERLGCAPHQIPTTYQPISDAYDFLFASYRQPARKHHGVAHIVDMLEQSELLNASRDQDYFQNIDAVQLAIFFHDVVYDPASKTNEEDSAEKLRLLLDGRIDPLTFDRAYLMILASKKHEATGDSDIDLFLDIDMSILGRPYPRYFGYAMDVMKEYEAVYKYDAYRNGRMAFLFGLMRSDKPLFLTKVYRQYEARAKINIEREYYLHQRHEMPVT